jgi:hypothetical protein
MWFSCADYSVHPLYAATAKAKLFKSFHPCTASTSSCSRATTTHSTAKTSTMLRASKKKVILPLVISHNIIQPFFCETIIYMFTIIKIVALFLYV